jgi:hypothetical protein
MQSNALAFILHPLSAVDLAEMSRLPFWRFLGWRPKKVRLVLLHRSDPRASTCSSHPGPLSRKGRGVKELRGPRAITSVHLCARRAQPASDFFGPHTKKVPTLRAPQKSQKSAPAWLPNRRQAGDGMFDSRLEATSRRRSRTPVSTVRSRRSCRTGLLRGRRLRGPCRSLPTRRRAGPCSGRR